MPFRYEVVRMYVCVKLYLNVPASDNYLHAAGLHEGRHTITKKRRHYHPKYTLFTLAPVSYLRSLVVRAVHRHRTDVGSIPVETTIRSVVETYIVDEFFSTVPG